MPRLMLDTNICIHAIKRNEPEIVRRLKRTRPQDVAISSVVAAELWTGVIKSRQRQHNEHALQEFLAFVEVLDWPGEAARVYGEIRAALEHQGPTDRRDGPAYCGARGSCARGAGDAESGRVCASRRSAN
jgi:predicted nucleic acid-binding protein